MTRLKEGREGLLAVIARLVLLLLDKVQQLRVRHRPELLVRVELLVLGRSDDLDRDLSRDGQDTLDPRVEQGGGGLLRRQGRGEGE